MQTILYYRITKLKNILLTNVHCKTINAYLIKYKFK